MLDCGVFVTLNLINRKTRESLFDYPIIYYWDSNDNLEDMFKDEEFIKKVMSKLSKEVFFDLDIMMAYVYENEEGDLVPVNKSMKLSETIEFPSKYEDELISSVLSYLYRCSYKKDPETSDIKELYESIKAKHPNKVNADVVMRYLQSSISEKYPEISATEIDNLTNRFLEIV